MNKRISNIFKGDKVIWMVFFFLCMISIVEVFSASSNLTYKSNNFIMPIIKHSGTIIFGVVVAIITLNIPCRYFKLLTPMALAISFITLLWVLVAGQNINGAQRVIEIPGFTFQPSEIAKGSLILAVAQILSAMQHEHGADRNAFKYIIFLTLPMAFLIMVENLSTALLLCSVIFLMMFIGRVPYRQLGWLMAIAGALVVLALSFIMLVGSNNADVTTKEATEQIAQKEETKKKEGAIESLFHRADTWKGRILKFSNKEEIAPEDYDLDKDAQVAHANIAIVSSNIIGKGPGNSVERDFLAQAFSDFIYAIVIEEMGILGAAFVVLLYVILMFRAARIASRCENNFPAFLIMGLALLFVVQASFNMMVAVGIVPVTVQSFPFISKGGTATIINCAYIGAMLSVSRSAKLRMKNSDTTSDTSDIKESEI